MQLKMVIGKCMTLQETPVYKQLASGFAVIETKVLFDADRCAGIARSVGNHDRCFQIRQEYGWRKYKSLRDRPRVPVFLGDRGQCKCDGHDGGNDSKRVSHKFGLTYSGDTVQFVTSEL